MTELRFDLYSVVRKGVDYHVIQLSKGVPTVVAQILAGVTNQDFVESVSNEGWVGSCPQWHHFMPIVTVPKGYRLGTDQLEFLIDSLVDALSR